MAGRTVADERAIHGSRGKIWWVVLLVFSLYVLEQNVEAILFMNNLQPDAGFMGGELIGAPEFAPGYVTVTRVFPGGPLAQAGVVTGDHIRFDRTSDWQRKKKANEAVGLTLDHNGASSHVTVITVPRNGWANPTRWQALIVAVANMMPALFGAFIVWRSRGRRAAMFLGAAVVTFGWWDSTPQLWESGTHVFRLFFVADSLGAAGFLFFPAFAMSFVEETLGRLRRWEWWLLGAYGGVGLLLVAINVYCILNILRVPVLGDVTRIGSILLVVGLVTTLYYMHRGWRRSARETQKRYTLILLAFSTVVLAQLLGVCLNLMRLNSWPRLFASPLFWTAAALSGIVAPALLAYSIFRQRVFDLGFAINRALVYAIISTGVLVTFGLIEWASEHFFPLKSIESNALLNAGVALTIFLTFHRVRDWVEGFVERVVFREWHSNEAQLRRFVKEAGFVAKTETLATSFVRELERFSGGAACALYLQDGGDYACAAGCVGGVAEVIDGDDPIALRMRADHAPVEVSDTASELAAELALPVVQRAELNGFVLMGPKANGESYRPDELEALGWAAHNIGLDLNALKILQLEQQTAVQQQELAILQARYEEQRAAVR